MHALVTGYRGYIGQHIFQALKDRGYQVTGLDIKEGDDLSGNALDALLDAGINVIFHLAADPRVGYSVEHPVAVMQNNIISSAKVLDFARKVGAHVVYSSSSAVVGDGDGPTNPYGLSKYASELEAVLYASLYKVPTVSLRYFNVYSEDQKADGPYATAIANWMEYIRQGKSPFITGNGEQSRDLVHVNDIVSANLFAMDLLQQGKALGSVFDVGTGSAVSLNDMKDWVQEILPNVAFTYIEDRPGDVFATCADIAPLKALGWKPTVGIEEGVKACFQTLVD